MSRHFFVDQLILLPELMIPLFVNVPQHLLIPLKEVVVKFRLPLILLHALHIRFELQEQTVDPMEVHALLEW